MTLHLNNELNSNIMKNLAFIFLLICALVSCKKATEKTVEKVFLYEYPQKWQLIRMYGQVANLESKGTDMSWQESYLLNSNGTFIKSRDVKGVLTVASGTFSFSTVLGEKCLTLTYQTDNSIIGSCTSLLLQETLFEKANTNNRMISSWTACDGPGLEYERVE